MKIYKDFNEEIYMSIAKDSGVKQTEKDIAYAKFCYFHNPKKRYSERIDEDAWILGCINKNNFRIIGMATRKEAQGKGLGTMLLNRARQYCYTHNIKKITTRTFSGKDFYIKAAKARIVGKKENDFLMEIDV